MEWFCWVEIEHTLLVDVEFDLSIADTLWQDEEMLRIAQAPIAPRDTELGMDVYLAPRPLEFEMRDSESRSVLKPKQVQNPGMQMHWYACVLDLL